MLATLWSYVLQGGMALIASYVLYGLSWAAVAKLAKRRFHCSAPTAQFAGVCAGQLVSWPAFLLLLFVGG